MNSLSTLVDSLRAGINSPSGMWPLRNIGVISCYNTLYIQHVSLFEPCVVVVLSGRKTIFGLGEPVVCAANSAIAVPGPASFDVRNEPDPHTCYYRSLMISFPHEYIEHMRNAHGIETAGRHVRAGALRFDHDLLDFKTFRGCTSSQRRSPCKSLPARDALRAISLHCSYWEEALLPSFL